MASKEQTEFVDGFSAFPQGFNSGIAPLSLPKTQLSYATNCTVRGRYVTHRPAYRKIKLLPDSGVNPGTSRFQGACYYKPDFGAESIMAQIGGRLYQILPDTLGNASIYDRTIQSVVVGNVVEQYDPNPANLPTAWLWQSENYVIINNGYNRPVFFDGIKSRRSITATFSGKTIESLVLPNVQYDNSTTQSVQIVLDSDFLDAIGTYIQISALGYFPFLMQVTAVQADNPSIITAVNVTGWSAAGALLPLGITVQSVSSPTWAGIITTGFPMPAIGSTVPTTVIPVFTGSVGDEIIITDGTGSLTSFTMMVTAANNSALTLQNINGIPNFIIDNGIPAIASDVIANELPIGRMGAYVQERNWISSVDGTYFIASDLIDSSSGTKQYAYRDAVLKWSQNTTKFTVPGGSGEINCIIALSALDASLGQGALQILCDNIIFTCSASTDATTWASTTSPILANTVIGFGGVGQNAAVVSNGDLLLKSGDATIHSLKLARQDFNQWGNLPISQEVNRVIEQENINQLSKITFANFDNRALESCSPIDSAGGIYSQGLIACDFDVTGSLQGKLPSVYDGVWKDLNVLQVVTGKFNKVDRCFVFHLNTTSNQVELWEILTDGMADDDGSGTPKPITWSFESPMVFNETKGKGEFDLVKLTNGAIFIKDLVGQAQITIWYRPDFDSCWHYWTSFSVCADNITSQALQYRMRIGIGIPPTDDCDPTVNKFPFVGRFFQTRVVISGSLTFMGAEFFASYQPESVPPPKSINEGDGTKPFIPIDAQIISDVPTKPCPPSQIHQTIITVANPFVVYNLDPNAENLRPANASLPAMAYQINGNGSTFGWNKTDQRWE